MISALAARRRFSDVSEAEVLALATSSEEDDARIYAERLRAGYPDRPPCSTGGSQGEHAGALWPFMHESRRNAAELRCRRPAGFVQLRMKPSASLDFAVRIDPSIHPRSDDERVDLLGLRRIANRAPDVGLRHPA
jgi:hypothetical protein